MSLRAPCLEHLFFANGLISDIRRTQKKMSSIPMQNCMLFRLVLFSERSEYRREHTKSAGQKKYRISLHHKKTKLYTCGQHSETGTRIPADPQIGGKFLLRHDFLCQLPARDRHQTPWNRQYDEIWPCHDDTMCQHVARVGLSSELDHF